MYLQTLYRETWKREHAKKGANVPEYQRALRASNTGSKKGGKERKTSPRTRRKRAQEILILQILNPESQIETQGSTSRSMPCNATPCRRSSPDVEGQQGNEGERRGNAEMRTYDPDVDINIDVLKKENNRALGH